MTETPAPVWIRVVVIALGVMIVGLGLVTGWVAWSMASDGLIRSTRYAPLSRADDPIRFWLFLSIPVVLAAAALAAGCYLVVDGMRGLRRRAAARHGETGRSTGRTQ